RALSRRGAATPHAASALQRPEGSRTRATRYRLRLGVRIRCSHRGAAHASRFAPRRDRADVHHGLFAGLRRRHCTRRRLRRCAAADSFPTLPTGPMIPAQRPVAAVTSAGASTTMEESMASQAQAARTPGATRAGPGEYLFDLARLNKIKGGPDY